MKDLHKLSKELEKFCIDNGIEKAKSGYLMGLFMNHKQALNIADVVGQSEQLCGKPNCNRQKLENSPLCSYHWDIANS